MAYTCGTVLEDCVRSGDCVEAERSELSLESGEVLDVSLADLATVAMVGKVWRDVNEALQIISVDTPKEVTYNFRTVLEDCVRPRDCVVVEAKLLLS